MIKKVQAISLRRMMEHKENGFKDPIFDGYKLAIISITNTDFDPIFDTGGSTLALQVDDVYPSSCWKWIDCQASREMTIEQAEEILSHIMIHHHRSKEDVFLLINCHMGESRSGGIARFAQEYCGIDDKEFAAMNNISPNQWIHSLLYYVYNQKYRYGSAVPAGMGNAFVPQKSSGEF